MRIHEPDRDEGCKGEVEVVGLVLMSPKRELAFCTACKTLLYDGDPMYGTPSQFRERMQKQKRPGNVSINARGRELDLGKWAGKF